jgi:arginase family enzyme
MSVSSKESSKIVVQDFTGVYAEQPFMQGLREQENTRYINCANIPGTDCYCDDDAVTAIREQIANAGIKTAEGIHFFDNGNYHYMSKIWTDMVQEPFSLVIFDHHPDMHPPRFGDILSCGGWVTKALDENKFIDNVVIIGVADHLVDEIREEIASTETRNDTQNKVTFIPESEIANIHASSLLNAHSSQPLYISIDKDVLPHSDIVTNWDQGTLRLEQMKSIITEIAKGRRIIGVDICGERAYDFEGDEQHTVSQADALNSRTNQELVEFLKNLPIPSRG